MAEEGAAALSSVQSLFYRAPPRFAAVAATGCDVTFLVGVCKEEVAEGCFQPFQNCSKVT